MGWREIAGPTTVLTGTIGLNDMARTTGGPWAWSLTAWRFDVRE